MSDIPPPAGPSASPPPAAPPRKRSRRALFAALALLALLAAGVWFVAFFWPYDPDALPRSVPAGTTFVLRANDLPGAMDECLLIPLVRLLLEAAGVPPRTVSDLSNDPETRKWLERLSGEECVFGLWQNGLFGVSFLGSGAARLRWQLQLFRISGISRLSGGGWRYDDADEVLPAGFHLHFDLEDGCLFAWIGEDDSGLRACLAAARGQGARLWSGKSSDSFRSFFAAPADAGTLRAWTAPLANLGVPALMELSVSPESIALAAAAPAAGPLADLPAPAAHEPPAVAFGEDAILAFSADGAIFPWLLSRFGSGFLPWARHALSLAGEFADGPLYGFLLAGAHGGRLAYGPMKLFGRGLKVPAILFAAEAPDPVLAQTKIDRALADCNRRYRGKFAFRADADGVNRLASEEPDEWTELLSDADRPAYALRDGWLWVCSSASALRQSLPGADGADEPWRKTFRNARGAAAAWGNLAAFERGLRDWIGLYQTACGFMGRVQSPEERRTLRALRTWGEELRGFGSLSLSCGGDGADGLWAAFSLGDAAAPAAERLLLALPALPDVRAPGNAAGDGTIPAVEPVPIAPPVADP